MTPRKPRKPARKPAPQPAAPVRVTRVDPRLLEAARAVLRPGEVIRVVDATTVRTEYR